MSLFHTCCAPRVDAYTVDKQGGPVAVVVFPMRDRTYMAASATVTVVTSAMRDGTYLALVLG